MCVSATFFLSYLCALLTPCILIILCVTRRGETQRWNHHEPRRQEIARVLPDMPMELVRLIVNYEISAFFDKKQRRKRLYFPNALDAVFVQSLGHWLVLKKDSVCFMTQDLLREHHQEKSISIVFPRTISITLVQKSGWIGGISEVTVDEKGKCTICFARNMYATFDMPVPAKKFSEQFTKTRATRGEVWIDSRPLIIDPSALETRWASHFCLPNGQEALVLGQTAYEHLTVYMTNKLSNERRCA